MRNYFPDFYIFETEEIVEIKPKHLIGSVDNIAKFNAARLQYKNFKIVTENEIVKLSNDKIKSLYMSGDLKFVDRYDIKFKERYM